MQVSNVSFFAVCLNGCSEFTFKVYAVCMNSHELRNKKIIRFVTEQQRQLALYNFVNKYLQFVTFKQYKKKGEGKKIEKTA